MAAAPLVVSVPDPEYAQALADLDGVDAVVWDMEQPHPRGAEIRLAVMPYMTHLRLSDVAAGLEALEVVQLQSAGYEQFLGEVPEGVTLCNAAGVHDASTAELALTLTLASIREIPEFAASRGPLALATTAAGARHLLTAACSSWGTGRSVGRSRAGSRPSR